MPSETTRNLIAVDIGNSRIKLGVFAPQMDGDRLAVPESVETFDLAIANHDGQFDAGRLAAWCKKHDGTVNDWRLASVHRGAGDFFIRAVTPCIERPPAGSTIRRIDYRDIPIPIEVDQPERVGIDRLLAAVAAERLREPGRAAIIVDLGTATTVDLLSESGSFAGGAIMPGVAMSARALTEQTDALPHVPAEALDSRVPQLGKSTVAAIESGLFWGSVGAVRELIRQYSQMTPRTPNVFLTGGASAEFANLLAEGATPNGSLRVRHQPQLVLSGIAVVHNTLAGT